MIIVVNSSVGAFDMTTAFSAFDTISWFIFSTERPLEVMLANVHTLAGHAVDLGDCGDSVIHWIANAVKAVEAVNPSATMIVDVLNNEEYTFLFEAGVPIKRTYLAIEKEASS